MPIYFAIDNVIVSRGELREKSTHLSALHQAVETRKRDVSVTFLDRPFEFQHIPIGSAATGRFCACRDGQAADRSDPACVHG